MDFSIYMWHRLLICVLTLLVLCGCYDSHKLPSQEEFLSSANCDIAQLRHLAVDGCYKISSDLVCVGRVTSSDRDGNFYRSMFIEDSTGALEVKLGTYNIATQYPVGLMVALHLKGSAVALKEGVLQVGLPPHSYDTTPRELETQEIIDKYIVRSSSVEEVEPLVCDITSLDSSKCGSFVAITGIHYTPMADDRASGYLRFVDADEHALYVNISTYSNFSTIEIPVTTLSVQGILYYKSVGEVEGRQFVITPRFKDDISVVDRAL